ncbi:MAG: TraR/DksA family transcriptional regulator [Planctomycetes bacterium]|nr:TraR/DksA family transcriptional regulator [Planctomycetota bacterium]
MSASHPLVLEAPAHRSSPFPPAELAAWKRLLLARRQQISGDIAGLVQDALDVESVQPSSNHLADGGSDSDIQDTSLGLADDDKEILRLIDRALAKIDGRIGHAFGLCEHTGQPIALERLELIPWTPLSIEGATYLEQHYLTLEDLTVE